MSELLSYINIIVWGMYLCFGEQIYQDVESDKNANYDMLLNLDFKI